MASMADAGDIGKICIDPSDETLCPCGSRGYLEAVVSAPALVRGAEAFAETGRSLYWPTCCATFVARLESIGDAAQLEDPTTTAMLRSRPACWATHSRACFNPNPAAVFVSTGVRGGAAEEPSPRSSACRFAMPVYERARPAATRGLVIGTCRLGRDDGAVGAAEFACRGMVTYR